MNRDSLNQIKGIFRLTDLTQSFDILDSDRYQNSVRMFDILNTQQKIGNKIQEKLAALFKIKPQNAGSNDNNSGAKSNPLTNIFGGLKKGGGGFGGALGGIQLTATKKEGEPKEQNKPSSADGPNENDQRG